MKNIWLNILFGCCLSSQCFSNSIQDLNTKIYLLPGSVYVSPDAIYVNNNGRFISVNGIACDDNGIYTRIDSETGIFGDTWECPNQKCKYQNYDCIKRCAICGTEKPN